MSNYKLYDYLNETGVFLYQVVRLEPKRFFQRRWNGKEWIYDLKGVRKVLYRLPEVIKAEKVFIVEGEKDVHTLEGLGLIATTCAGGSNSWKEEYNIYFKDKEVIIIPDNDDAGRQFGKTVARGIFPYAKTVKIIDSIYKMNEYNPGEIYPGKIIEVKHLTSPKGYDITDWIEDEIKVTPLAEGKSMGEVILESLMDIINKTDNYVTLKDLEQEEPKLRDKPKFLSNSTKENGNGITKDMITIALQAPIEELISVDEKGKAICPFHNDTEASLDTRGNFYYCYSCAKHGSVVDLYMFLNNVDFKEAIRRMNQ